MIDDMDARASAPLEELLAHRPWVRGLARALTRDPAAADDLEQDAWVSALESPPRHGGSLRGWFATVMRNRLRDRARSEGRRARREESAAAPEASPSLSPADLAAAAEAHRRVVEAVMRLAPDRRDAVLLRYFEGIEPAEIARRRGIPAETVRSRLARALEDLRRDLGGDAEARRALLLPLLGPECGKRGPWVPLAVGGAVVVLAAVGAVASLDRQRPDAAPPASTTTAMVPAPAVGIGPAPSAAAPPSGGPSPVPPGSTGASPPAGEAAPADPPPAAGRLRVEVVDVAGRPVVGAAVTIHEGIRRKGEGAAFTRTRETGDKGTTEFQDVGPEAVFTARHGDLAGAAAPKEGEATLRIPLGPATSMNGRVRTAAGEPVEGARLRLSLPFVKDAELSFTVLGDATGSFRFDGLPSAPGGGFLEARAEGFATANVAVGGEGVRAAAPLDVVLVAAGRVRGRCVDEEGKPVAGTLAQCVAANASMDTGVDGRFLLADVPFADAEVTLESETHAYRRLRLSADRGAECELGDVVLLRGADLRGVVVDAAGAPVEGASINLSSDEEDQFVRWGTTDAEGRFALAHVGPGTHAVIVTAGAGAEESGFGRRGVARGVLAGGEGVRIAVTAGLMARIDLLHAGTGVAVRARVVHVSITREDGKPVAHSGSSSDGGRTSLDVDLVEGGPLTVSVRVEGFRECVLTKVRGDPDRGVVLQARLEPEGE